VTFPGGLTTITVTGENLLDFGGAPLNGFVVFSASGVAADPAAGLVLEGSAAGQVVNGVMEPVVIPTTDSVSPAFTYTVELKLATADADPPPRTGIAVPAALGSTVDLSDLL
jgi:hypothetical protein